ncbi:MAG: dihydrodipicolinate synthase family protein [Comamonas sp.]
MHQPINGIIPVMLTPYTAQGDIDWEGLDRLTEWYIAQGADALFAVCQSSEMQKLTLDERVEIARRVKTQAAGRLPVIASGHVSDDRQAQREELLAIAATGVDGLVLVSNRLDPQQQGAATWRHNLEWLLAQLPPELPLGLYECPAPFRRLLSDEELSFCAHSGRFVVLKDVSCDLPTVARRVQLVQGTPLAIVNANAAIAHDAIKAGAYGFSGVFTNIHPDLYKWLLTQGPRHPALADELAVFLALSAMAEPMGYPVLAKRWHQRLGTFASLHSRVVDFDIFERFWALEALIDRIAEGGAQFRARIAALPA